MTKKEIIYKHTLENITYKNNKNILNIWKEKGSPKMKYTTPKAFIIKLILQSQTSIYNIQKYVSLKQKVINLNFHCYLIYV